MTNNKLSIITFTFILAGCGGGGSNSNPPTTPPINPTPVNRAPTLSTVVPVTAYSQTNKLIVLTATDPDGDVLTYSATSSHQGVVVDVDSTNLTLSAKDEFHGIADITVTVSDGFLSDSSSFTINVLQASIPPVLKFDNSQLSTPPSIPSL